MQPQQHHQQHHQHQQRAQPQPHPPPPPAPIPVPTPATANMTAAATHHGSPPPLPSRANLKTWWRQFTFAQKVRKEAAVSNTSPVFGVPLKESLRYANVQISTANANGELYVWGYIPVVVAKCGLYLKEHATEVEGTFRVSGSNKRMRELQAVFETPPRYGRNLDWKTSQYTTHDVASVFRRYLTQMPEPVIPHHLYYDFRNALSKRPFVLQEATTTIKQLIRSMPRSNQYLLLYVLDLLSVFARKSDKNLMTATNLAVIFRPGLISHPKHEMMPAEHALSQEVLEFLIAQQDWFMLDIPPPPRTDSVLVAPTQPLSPEEEDSVFMVPSESDEEPPEGGWKLVERQQKKLARRRTIDSSTRGGAEGRSQVYTAEPGELTPLQHSGSVTPAGGNGNGTGQLSRFNSAKSGVGRSLTMPSRKTNGEGDTVAKRPRRERPSASAISHGGDLMVPASQILDSPQEIQSRA
ncbi:hypothetical protein BOTBODRAFT_27950 [Botryobasidium botryosum FD-172 SS1]|uniref:Rho-GAP domain-containing protein n=1 Tax=Botryobasidium botryosum (strain FD-172 SS1) TaxID=930990 RepID=A0A067N5I8_BOTB1|nr:hypothetical protein BOTBODRAFT_27950 [Botryobasidium botryosum FD-172 SS1]